jgi:hypothetical protein
MPGIKGFDEIEERLRSHRGKLASDEWSNLKRIFVDIYQRNRNELCLLLEEPSKNDELSIELFQNIRPQTVKEQYTNEVLRSLFNYLSSLSSLVDTGMRIVKKYPKEKLKKYIELRDVVVVSNINIFFGDLRNYIQHYGIPPLGWEIRLVDNGFNNCTYYLNYQKLLTWKSWSPKSKEFIGEENVNLLKSIREHGEMIDSAFHTLLSTFPELHSVDVAAYNELMHRRNDILSGKIKL